MEGNEDTGKTMGNQGRRSEWCEANTEGMGGGRRKLN